MNIFSWADKNFDPKNDHILITGASSGIGLEYLRLLSKIPCTIYVVSEEKEKLENVAQEVMSKSKCNVVPLCCDFLVPSQVDTLLNEIKNLNIKILVNNAGIGKKGYFVDHKIEDVDRIHNVNVGTPLKILLVTLPRMLTDNIGVVIQITSVNVVTPVPYSSLYTAGKAGLSSAFSAIMYENRKTGVVFSEVRPGTTETPFHEKQGVKPQSMFMSASEVANRSLNNIDKRVFLPNKIDRVLVKICGHLPLFTKMGIGLFFLKRRLGID